MVPENKNKCGPWRSPLWKHRDWIVAMLDSGVTYQKVSEELFSKFKISRVPSTIWAFVYRLRDECTPPSYIGLSGGVLLSSQPVNKEREEDNDAAYARAKERIAANKKAKAAPSENIIDAADVYPEP